MELNWCAPYLNPLLSGEASFCKINDNKNTTDKNTKHATNNQLRRIASEVNLEHELKMSCIDLLTSKHNISIVDLKNFFSPRILIATESFIGYGLDSDDLYGVIRIGFSENTLSMVQEMGRCGRNRCHAAGELKDIFVLIIYLQGC